MRGPLLVICALVVVVMVCPSSVLAAWGSGGDSVLMKGIEVLTLYDGKMTKGRRSSPVPQLECVSGGTAPCDAFRPRVVQCYNRGWDGEGVQWECKTDMDNAYRFGNIEVSCEGYEHRDDPYVLKGSCGLRYTIDYTKEGLNQNQKHNYYGGGNSYYSTRTNPTMSKQSSIADLIVFIAVGLMLWAFYKTCTGSRRREDAWSSTDDDYPAGGGGGYGWFGQGGGPRPTAPPPPGGYGDASCRNRNAGAGSTGAGGFWTGAVAGGLLGYMFGNRGTGGYNTGYGGYGGYGGGGGGWSFGGGGGGGGSSGTRSASGFGGTSNR